MKMQHITEIDALKAKIAGGSPREVITLKTELQLMVEQRETLWKEIDALKAENERLREKLKPILPPWSPDYGLGPVSPDRVYQYFEEGAWYDCKKMDLGFYIADNVPVRELFTRPIDAAMSALPDTKGEFR